jgi:hypothetical protein
MRSALILLLVGCTMPQTELVWREDGHTYRPVDDVATVPALCPPTSVIRLVVDENGDQWLMAFRNGEIARDIPMISGKLYGRPNLGKAKS